MSYILTGTRVSCIGAVLEMYSHVVLIVSGFPNFPVLLRCFWFMGYNPINVHGRDPYHTGILQAIYSIRKYIILRNPEYYRNVKRSPWMSSAFNALSVP